jgi:hypothetical protein
MYIYPYEVFPSTCPTVGCCTGIFGILQSFYKFFFALEEKGIYFVGEKSPTPDLNSVS